MENGDLAATIKEKVQQGESIPDIRNDLFAQGWKEQDIDAGIAAIQKEALKQLPVFSHFFRVLENPQIHTKLSTTKMTALILSGCVVAVFIVLGMFYFFLDPFNMQAGQRDKHREADLEVLKSALAHYYTLHNNYPSSLKGLTPDVLQAIPKDPESGGDYSYSDLDNGSNFQLCITFEVQTVPCIYGTPLQPIISGDQAQTPQ
jgi:hypothetical protein